MHPKFLQKQRNYKIIRHIPRDKYLIQKFQIVTFDRIFNSDIIHQQYANEE
jgi:hypothetical protein